MIFATSLPRFKAFLGDHCPKPSDLQNCLSFIVPCIIPFCRRSVTAAARSILNDFRHPAWLLRWLGGSKAPEVLLAAAQHQLQAAARCTAGNLHVLVVDSTMHTQQGKLTENTYSTGNTKKRSAKSTRRQKQHHRRFEHCFVFALLLTPNGLRIPYWLPYYTQAHCRLFDWKHQSQATLAAQLIDTIPVPQGSRVVVVGDTAFDAKQIRQACQTRGWQWVVPLNPERVLSGSRGNRPQVRSLCKQLTATDFRKVSFRLDQGEWAALARVSPKRTKSAKHVRTYWVHHRTATVYNIGEVALLFSTKQEPTPGEVKVQKLLISNAVTATTEQILYWYSLRWQIEMFFK